MICTHTQPLTETLAPRNSTNAVSDTKIRVLLADTLHSNSRRSAGSCSHAISRPSDLSDAGECSGSRQFESGGVLR